MDMRNGLDPLMGWAPNVGFRNKSVFNSKMAQLNWNRSRHRVFEKVLENPSLDVSLCLRTPVEILRDRENQR